MIGFEIMGGSAYLPLGSGYDAENDVLTIGETTDDPAAITQCGDFIGYWEIDEEGTPDEKDPIGVALRQASKHLASVTANL